MIIDSYTKLLLHMRGADASTTFTDECGKTVSANGNAQIDTAQYRFPQIGSSCLLDGTGDSLSVVSNSDFAIGTGDVTIETCFRANAINDNPIMMCGTYEVATRWRVYLSGGHLQFGLGTGAWSWGTLYTETSSSIATGVWTHIAIVRSGNTLYLFVNGFLQTGYSTSISDFTNSADNLYIGSYFTTSPYFNGWLAETRISKGIARWTSDFPPPPMPYGYSMPQILEF